LAIAAQFMNVFILKLLFNLFAAGCFVFTAFWVWRKEHKKVEEFENSLPCLEVSGYSVDFRTAIPESSFLHIRFTNNPTNPLAGSEAEAKNVLARITYYDGKGNQLFPYIYGRWSDTPEPYELKGPKAKTPRPMSDYLAINFTIGQTQELAIALKYAGSPICYPFNHESYEYPQFKDARRELRGGSFMAEVELIGQRVNSKWKLRFSTAGWVLKADYVEQIY